MFRNPFYYFPIEANQLYHAEIGSKEYKKALRKITSFFKKNAFALYDEEAYRIDMKMTKMAVLLNILAVLMLICGSVLPILKEVKSVPEIALHIVGAVICLFGAIVIGLCFYLCVLRKKVILRCAEIYEPVCEYLGDEILEGIEKYFGFSDKKSLQQHWVFIDYKAPEELVEFIDRYCREVDAIM